MQQLAAIVDLRPDCAHRARSSLFTYVEHFMGRKSDNFTTSCNFPAVLSFLWFGDFNG